MSATFCKLKSAGLIAVRGADAASFLQAQLTSDVAGVSTLETQYTGYCSPKGRLLAIFLLWRQDEGFLLQLPAELREALQRELSKYVLRARVTLSDATAQYALFGIAGGGAGALPSVVGHAPDAPHEVVSRSGVAVTRLPVERYLVLASADDAPGVRHALSARGGERPESDWIRLEIEAGIPVITHESQDQYVPQMVNLDLIGGVSYTKGCYPGQEIVARTHYLGRLKQRMYRVHLDVNDAPAAGDGLYEHEFGPDQASGAILMAVRGSQDGFDALAVVRTDSVERGSVHWRSLDGPALEFLPLPYALPS